MKRGRAPHVHGARSTRQLSSSTWPDFDRLFSAQGGVWGGCWCLYFHEPGGFDYHDYESNRRKKHALVEHGSTHGTIVYCGEDPVGWCQFGPREELARIDHKRGYTPTSPDPWRITCLFVSPSHRKSGVADLAVKDSLIAMGTLGAKVVEAYPVEGTRSASLLWSGTPGLFESAGFSKVVRLGKSSWIYSIRLPR